MFFKLDVKSSSLQISKRTETFVLMETQSKYIMN